MTDEKLKKDIKEVKKIGDRFISGSLGFSGATMRQVGSLTYVVKVAESVLNVKGFPERIDLNNLPINQKGLGKVTMPEAVCFNEALSQCKAVIASKYVLRSDLQSVEEIATIISDAGFLRGYEEENERFDIAESIVNARLTGRKEGEVK